MISRILNKFKKRTPCKFIAIASIKNKKGYACGLFKKENDFSYENLQFYIVEGKKLGKDEIQLAPYCTYIINRIIYRGKLTNLVKKIYDIQVS